MPDFLYRYEEVHFSRGSDEFDNILPGCNIELHLYKYSVIKRTPKGVWIQPTMGAMWNIKFDLKKFVLLDGKKRFAYPTKKEALESFIARKNRQIEILSHQLDNAKIALNIAKNHVIKAE